MKRWLQNLSSSPLCCTASFPHLPTFSSFAPNVLPRDGKQKVEDKHKVVNMETCYSEPLAGGPCCSAMERVVSRCCQLLQGRPQLRTATAPGRALLRGEWAWSIWEEEEGSREWDQSGVEKRFTQGLTNHAEPTMGLAGPGVKWKHKALVLKLLRISKWQE